MAIPEIIEELAHKVRTEIYGRDVREALATSMEATAEVAEWSRVVAQQIIDGKFDEGAISTEIERKLNELEVQYAPKLTTIQNEVENARGNDTSLGGRLNSISQDLAQRTKRMNNELHSVKQRKAMVTIIDDDGRNKVLDTWLPLLQTNNFKLDVAVVTSYPDNNSSYLTWEQLADLKSNYKVDIVNHSHKHPNLGELSEVELRMELEQSIQELYSRGFDSGNILVYPRGNSTHETRVVVSNYFRGAVYDGGGLNRPPLYTYNLRRVNLFSGQDAMVGIETLKGYVDQAIEEKAWLVFLSHSQFPGFNENTMTQLIDYINSKDIEWVHAAEGYDKMGNIIHIGDNEDSYEGGVPESVSFPYRIIDVEGVTHSNIDEGIYNLGDKKVDYNTPLTEFPRNKYSYAYITRGNNTVNLFPGGVGGMIESFHATIENFSYQRFKPNNSNEIYQRRWVDGEWRDFARVGEDIKYSGTDHAYNSPPSAFESGKITTTVITSANRGDFPESGGLLTTYSYGPYLYHYQTFKPQSSNNLYLRSSNTDGSAWNTITQI